MASRSDHARVFIPPPLLFVVPLLVGLWWNARSPWSIMAAPSRVLMAFAIVTAVTGLAIAIAAVRTFRQRGTTVLPALRPTSVIVASGPYRFTRNPMYVGLSLIYIGISAALNSIWPLLLLPVALIAVDRYVIRREERYLSSKFGEQYEMYRRHVRRWL